LNGEELAFAGLVRQAEAVRGGEVSARELVDLSLERIARLDPALNAFRVVMAERALAEAERADERLDTSDGRPLHGVPIAVKDNVDVAGEITTHGTGAFDGPAEADAEIVRRLRAAGAIVVGKTHLPELAISGFTESATWGVTRNPWDPDRTPGGSSGGSGVAVAAGMVPCAIASDGAGSIRIPAACCGVFGLKPQRGRVTLMPDREHWHGLSVFGCLARKVADSALFHDVVMGPAPGDADRPEAPRLPFLEAARSRGPRLRIALSLSPLVPVRVHPEVRAGVEGTADLLRALGHRVERADPAYSGIGRVFFPRYLGGIRDDARRMPRPERLERRTRGFARLGQPFTPGAIARARATERTVAERINRVFDDHDVLIAPVTSRPPVEVGRWEGLGALRTLVGMSRVYPFTAVWNVTGQPAAAVPAGFTADGLPLSVQLVGRPGDEPTLLSLAAEIEAERPWAHHRPPLAATAGSSRSRAQV
jgi:amidase